MFRSPLPAFTVAAAFALSAAPAPAGPDDGTAAAIDDGFVALFDGETLAGWEQRNGFATYRVETVDGAPAIVGRTAKGSPNSFLCTKKTYKNFVLEFEVKLPTRALNSGVQVRSSAKGEDAGKGNNGAGRVFGPQVEIESSPGDAGYIYGEAMGGWLDPKDQHPKQETFENGGWNKFRVEARGDTIKTFVNGEPVSDLKTDKDEAKTPGFVGLQVHSYKGPHPGVVMWRNVRIKALTGGDGPGE